MWQIHAARRSASRLTLALPRCSMTSRVFGSENSVIAIVGDYEKVKGQLGGFKDITVLDTEGKTITPSP